MSMSRAALDGVQANGLRWRFNGPVFKDLTPIIGRYRDDAPETDEQYAELSNTVQQIAKRSCEWALANNKPSAEAALCMLFFESQKYEIECLQAWDAGDDVEEIVDILNQFYDFFDYHRVLVQ